MSLVAVAAVVASLSLMRQRVDSPRRGDEAPATEPPAKTINLDEIRRAGF